MNEDLKDNIIRLRSKGNDYYKIANQCSIPVRRVRYIIAKSKDKKIRMKDINSTLDVEEIVIYKNLTDRRDLDDKYIENKMGRSIDFLKNQYNKYIKSKEKQKLNSDLEYVITRMIYAGFAYSEIAETLNVNIDSILEFVSTRIEMRDEQIDANLNIYKLLKFSRYKCKIGDIYRLKVFPISVTTLQGNSEYKEVKVLDKYPYIVKTDKGFFTYLDLYNGIKIN